MIVAGHQPNYLPWLGFFDKMLQCDVFIIEDCVQFEKRGFTNRNKIKTFEGVKWLTVPVKHTKTPLPIDRVRIFNGPDCHWAKQHWLILKHSYSRAPFWRKYRLFFEQIYEKKWTRLIDLNMHLIKGLMKFLGINKPLVLASSLDVSGKKSELVLGQCKALGATTLFSGVGAREYLNLRRFKEEGINVVFQNFRYPVYPQVTGEFTPNLSVVDYLFWNGAKIWRSENMLLKR